MLTPLLLMGGVLWVLFLPLRLCARMVLPLGRRLKQRRLYRRLDSIVLFDSSGWFRWDLSEAGTLLARIRWTHGILAGVVGVEWFAMCVFGTAAGLGYLAAFSVPIMTVMLLSFVAVIVFAAPALLGQAYYVKLLQSWTSLKVPLCGGCGCLRDADDQSRCPNCGSHDPPVEAGAVPFLSAIAVLSFLQAAGFPIAAVVCGSILFRTLHHWLSLSNHITGAIVLAITVSLTSLGAYFLRFNLRMRRLMIELHQPDEAGEFLGDEKQA